MIDLRSDTVTRPTDEMRLAMARAEVGDDVYGEDPTVNRLEERAAEVLGKQAALFVPTGTMGNTIALKLHTRHGQEILCEARSHVFDFELAMMGWFAGCVPRPVAGARGILRWQDIEPSIRVLSPHWAPTGLIAVENTHNMAGGTVYPIGVLAEIFREAHARNLPVHMDGARLFNASACLDVRPSEIARYADTVMFCLSKGLGAPAGSMLAGSKEAIDEARLLRKRLGGGMRQAGVLAAAGLIALEKMPERLNEDHDNARALAQGLADIRGIRVDPESVMTNIVIFEIEADLPSAIFSRRLLERGVLANAVGERRLRMVTHYDVSRAQCLGAIAAVESVSASARQAAAH